MSVIKKLRHNVSLSQEDVRRLLSYDPTTGVLVWRVSRGSVKAGKVITGYTADDYQPVRINRTPYLAHRLIWLYVTGSHPQGEIDHKDGNRKNNKFDNLRDVSATENQQNRRQAPITNRSTGILGVTVTPNRKRYRAQIYSEKKYYLGTFDSVDEARNAYVEAKRKMHSGCLL